MGNREVATDGGGRSLVTDGVIGITVEDVAKLVCRGLGHIGGVLSERICGGLCAIGDGHLFGSCSRSGVGCGSFFGDRGGFRCGDFFCWGGGLFGRCSGCGVGHRGCLGGRSGLGNCDGVAGISRCGLCRLGDRRCYGSRLCGRSGLSHWDHGRCGLRCRYGCSVGGCILSLDASRQAEG